MIDLSWHENTPTSTLFDDVYFNSDGGIEESLYNFFEGNELFDRWRKLTCDDQFRIGEFGFGTGLNALLAAQQFERLAPEGARLEFVSIEKYPLSRGQLERVYQSLPQLQPYTDNLLTRWHVYAKGIYRIPLSDRCQLTLVIGDIETALNQLLVSEAPSAISVAQATIDAWFFDGFSPAKNPEMWHIDRFKQALSLSHSGTTAATFSAARIVRDALTGAGFDIIKRPGLGKKREVISARVNESQIPNRRKFKAPWWVVPALRPKHVTVVGAGLAGAHTARAFANRGIDVTLIEQNDRLGGGASGNPQGILYTKLSHRPEISTEFALAALQFAQAHYRQLLPDADGWIGVIQLDESSPEFHQKVAARFSEEFVSYQDRETLSQRAGIDVASGGLVLEQSGWLSPCEVLTALVDHPRISLMLGSEVTQIEHTETSTTIFTDSDTFVSDLVVICTANDTNRLTNGPLDTRSIRGQVDTIRTQTLPSMVITGDGYIAPAGNQQATIGASFVLNSSEVCTTADESRENIERAASLSHELRTAVSIDARASLRCATMDYLPILGPITPTCTLAETYGELAKDRKKPIDQVIEQPQRIWLNIGHGSRGLCSTPLCAELIASIALGEFLPVDSRINAALSSRRFNIRRLIRGQI